MTLIDRDTKRAAGLAARFQERVGRAPDGVWKAPGRVNLIGEHTDYNDGFVLPLAIEQSAYVALARRDDDELRITSLQLGSIALRISEIAPRAVKGWAAYVAGALWALAEEGVALPGFDVVLDSDVPVGAGLSSSAAVECATILAASELVGSSLERPALARLAQRGELEIAGMPCGIMDQMVSLCATSERALLIDCRSLELRHISLPLKEQALNLLVIDTRAPHRLVEGEYASRRRACEEASRMLGVPALRDATLEAIAGASAALGSERFRRARHVVTENCRVMTAIDALEDGDLLALGKLLNASHASLRDDFEVTVTEPDLAAQSAVDAGALGARMIGGGFGGSVLALTPSAKVEFVAQAVADAFARGGLRPPSSFVAVPTGGAARLC
jgi:galactokinase